MAREPLERAIEEPARRLRLDRGCDRGGGARIPRVVPAVDAVLARSGPAGARFARGGRNLQVFAVRRIDRAADPAARHDFPAALGRGDPPRSRGERPSSGDALLHQLDRRGRRSARRSLLADRLARDAGHDAVGRSTQPRARRGGSRHRAPGRACRRRRGALRRRRAVREPRRPPVSRSSLRHRSRLFHLRDRLDQDVVAGARLVVPRVRADALGLHHRPRARRPVDPPPHRPARRPGALRRLGAGFHGSGSARHDIRLPLDIRLDGVGARRASAQRQRLSAVQPVRPRAGVRGDAPCDFPRRNDAAAFHTGAVARRARRARNRPGVRRKYPRRHRRRAARRARADACRRAQARLGSRCRNRHTARHLGAALLEGGIATHPCVRRGDGRHARRDGNRARRDPGTRAPFLRGLPLRPGCARVRPGVLLPRRQDGIGRCTRQGRRPVDPHQRQIGRSPSPGSESATDAGRVHHDLARGAAFAHQAGCEDFRQHRLGFRPERRGRALAQRPRGGRYRRDRAGHGGRSAFLLSPRRPRLPRRAQQRVLRGREELFRPSRETLRRDHVRTFQSLGQRRRSPLHHRVLSGHQALPRARRPVRAVAARLRFQRPAVGLRRFGARRKFRGL